MQITFASPGGVFFNFAVNLVVWGLIAALMSGALWVYVFGLKWRPVPDGIARRWLIGAMGVSISIAVACAYVSSYRRVAAITVNTDAIVLDYVGLLGRQVRVRHADVAQLDYDYWRWTCNVRLRLASGDEHRSVTVRVKAPDDCRRLHGRLAAALRTQAMLTDER